MFRPSKRFPKWITKTGLLTGPRRFEIHRVDPPVGSEEGGARVTVEGIGFGDAAMTSQAGVVTVEGIGLGRWMAGWEEMNERRDGTELEVSVFLESTVINWEDHHIPKASFGWLVSHSEGSKAREMAAA